MDLNVPDGYEGDPPPWAKAEVAAALQAAEMPPESLALYARWWQLETWLRELAYVELRAGLGTNWVSAVNQASGRQQKDARYTHMVGPDNDNPLAYLDYSQLIELITARWDQFGYALLDKAAWAGRQAELSQIRHRIGHLRSPHSDDLGRLEQTLRDLERGTFIALASYNRRCTPDPTAHHDPVTTGWIRGKHPDAQRLLRHADKQYETGLAVTASLRPWATWPAELDRADGLLWHAHFFMRGRRVEPAALWRDSYTDSVRPLIVHMLADNPFSVEFTFSAVDPGTKIADAIGHLFEAVLHNSEPWSPDEIRQATTSRATGEWQARAARIDYRVLSGSGWSIVGEDTVPISNFGAGGGVQSVPSW